MVDRITKNLLKFSKKEQKEITLIVSQILVHHFTGLDIKKLIGREDTYRARKGQIRIIFRKTKTEPHIIAIERRSDTTY